MGAAREGLFPGSGGMGWLDWLLVLFVVPPLTRLAGDYWLAFYRELRGDVARLRKGRRRNRRLTVFWPD